MRAGESGEWRQRAEERTHWIPIKLLFPMAFLIFPEMYVIPLGAAIPRVVGTFRGPCVL